MKFDAAKEKMSRALKQNKSLRQEYIANISTLIYDDQFPGMGYVHIKYPLGWWQAFKHRFLDLSLPAWRLYLKKYPVKFKRHVIKPYDSYEANRDTEPPKNLSTTEGCDSIAERLLNQIFESKRTEND